MRDVLGAILEQRPFSRGEAATLIDRIVGGEGTPEQIGGLLVGLQMRGATLDEIVGFASAMRAHARNIQWNHEGAKAAIDICGTGGDGAGTFNISTAAAFVVAGAGVTVAKHGNRAVSSGCGSTDVLGALGVRAATEPEEASRALGEIGLGFLSAPHFHPALKRLAEIRRSLGIRTVFNLLGPLTNPAGVRRQLIGIFDRKLLALVATALGELGSTEVMVVAGEDGLDEITLSGATHVAHLVGGSVRTYTITPGDAGLEVAPPESLRGESPEGNARILLEVLHGEPGPRRDVVLLNAAAALLVAGRASDLRDGVTLAKQSIESGAAARILSEHQTSKPIVAGRPILDEIALRTRARVARAQIAEPISRLVAKARAAGTPHDFRAPFESPGLHVIAEVKLASPSEGDIAPGADPVAVASDYLAHGATALSVLTEPDFFKGNLSYLRAIRDRHPEARLLLKDFVLDEYQVFQARAAGADAALILLAIVTPERARVLFNLTSELGMTPLVEAHDEAELALAGSLGARLIGINNRNLKTMQVSLDAAERLAALAPPGATLISESGIKTHADTVRLRAAGYNGFLVGTQLMRSGAPGPALKRLLEGG